MVSSWLSSDTQKLQEISGVDPIKSLLRSLNLTRTRLPSTLTFREDPPGPGKSLCEIVRRISNHIDLDIKSIEHAIELIPHNTTENNSQESCTLNSRTESAIQGFAIRENNERREDSIYTGELLNQYYLPKFIDIYSKNCGQIYKQADLNAESLERIRRWRCGRSVTPKIGDIGNGTYSIESNSSQKKVTIAEPADNITTTLVNFNNNHRSNNSVVPKCIFDSGDEETNGLGLTQYSTIHSQSGQSQKLVLQFPQRLENTSTQTLYKVEEEHQELVNHQKIDGEKKIKNISQKQDLQNKFSPDIDGLVNNNKKLKETNSENPYQRIHLSINNYFHSHHNSPSVSPKRSKALDEKVNGEKKKLSKKNITKVIAKRKSFSKTIRTKHQIKKTKTIDNVENNKTECECPSLKKSDSIEILTEVNTKITSDKELSNSNQSNNNQIENKNIRLNSSKYYPQVLETLCDKVNLINNRSMDYQRKKQAQMEQMSCRVEAVLSGDRKTVAKPSKVLIPQSVRARHIFQPYANIQELPEININTTKLENKKKSCHFNRNQYTSSVIHKNTVNSNSMWKLSIRDKGSPFTQNTIWQNGQTSNGTTKNITNSSVKYIGKRHEPPVNIKLNFLECKTSPIAARNSSIAEDNHKYQDLIKINKKTFNDKMEKDNANNPHSNTLRILKELLASTDEDYVTEESVEFTDETVSLDKSSCSMKKSISNIELRPNRKTNITQSFQAVSETVEHLDAYTEIDANLLVYQDTTLDPESQLNIFPNVSSYHFNRTFVNAEVSCSFPTIFSLSEESSYPAIINKSYRISETQTSKTSFQVSYKEKKDICIETLRLRLNSKYVNTERCALIDTATGKDVLEIQNFCCDTQLINTESSMFDNYSFHDLKTRIHGVESQVNTLNSLISIGIQNRSTEICTGLISSLSNELILSKRSLIDNGEHEYIKCLPIGVIRAFEIAAERAQNLQRAIEIYREHEMKKQNELKTLSVEIKKDKKISNLLQEEERKSQSIMVALEQISKSEKAFHIGLTKLVLHQEVQFTLETILDQVLDQVSQQSVDLEIPNPRSNQKHDFIDESFRKDIIKLDSTRICDLRKSSLQSLPQSTRTKILPIVYGAVCTFIFWSLQFSSSCELG